MAYSITEQPTSPNGAYTRLPYTVSSTNVDIYTTNFQYIVDVYESGSTQRITRLKQTPNPQKVATFDPSRIFQGELDEDRNWKVNGAVEPENTVKTFTLKFGEEYSLSPNTPIEVFPNITTTDIQVFPAIVEPNNGISYNFQTGSWVDNSNAYLTNCPAAQTPNVFPNTEYAYLVNSKDYLTLTVFKDIASTGGYITLSGMKVENGIGTLVLFDAITLSSPNDEFNTLGVGPQNMAEYLPSWKTAIDNGDINLIYTTNDPGGVVIYINDLWDGIPRSSGNGALTGLNQPIKQCTDEYTRFAFINSYGFWDYYNSYTPVRRTSNIAKQSVTEPQLNYSSISSPYNIEDRGEKDYNVDIVDRFEITTDFLDQANSVWLEELMESPSVYIQKGSDFVPIVITNSNYTANTNGNRQKLFQYTFEFEPSNQPFGDWDIDLPFVEPVVNTQYTLQLNTGLDITTASIEVTDPFPGGINTVLGTLNNMTGSISGSVSESYSTTNNYTAISNTTKLSTTLVGNVTSSNQYRITGSLFVNDVLVSEQTQIKDFPLSFDFSYVGDFRYADTAVTRVNLEEILPIPVNSRCNFDLMSASIDDEIPVDQRNPNLRYWYYKLNEPVGTGWLTRLDTFRPFANNPGNNGFIHKVYYGRGVSSPAASNVFSAAVPNVGGYVNIQQGCTFAVDRDINSNYWITSGAPADCGYGVDWPGAFPEGTSLWEDLSPKPYDNYVIPLEWSLESPADVIAQTSTDWIEVNSITSSFENAKFYSSSLWETAGLRAGQPIFLARPGAYEWGFTRGNTSLTPGCLTGLATSPAPAEREYNDIDYTADLYDIGGVHVTVQSNFPIPFGAYQYGSNVVMVSNTPSIRGVGTTNVSSLSYYGAGSNWSVITPTAYYTGSYNSSTTTRNNLADLCGDTVTTGAFYRKGLQGENVFPADEVFSDPAFSNPLSDGYYNGGPEPALPTFNRFYRVIEGRVAYVWTRPIGDGCWPAC